MRTFANQARFIPVRDFEQQGLAVDFDEFDLAAYFHADGRRRHMANVDLDAYGMLAGGKKRT